MLRQWQVMKKHKHKHYYYQIVSNGHCTTKAESNRLFTVIWRRGCVLGEPSRKSRRKQKNEETTHHDPMSWLDRAMHPLWKCHTHFVVAIRGDYYITPYLSVCRLCCPWINNPVNSQFFVQSQAEVFGCLSLPFQGKKMKDTRKNFDHFSHSPILIGGSCIRGVVECYCCDPRRFVMMSLFGWITFLSVW